MQHSKKTEENASIDILNNATSALLLLKEWLSISESQICSTEVLSEQLPKVNQLLETSMNDISKHFGIIASNTKKIKDEVEYIDSKLDVVEIEGKETGIPEYLLHIAQNTQDSNTKDKILGLIEALKNQEASLHNEVKKAAQAIKENSSEISDIVVGMQFQDRVSQNIMITINVMRSIVQYLEKEIKISLPNVTREDRKKLLNKDFAKEVLSQLRLGELQLSFVKHLLEHGYIEDESEIGFSIESHTKKSDDSVDLF